VVAAVGGRIDAQPGQAQHGLGQIRDRRIGQPVYHEQLVSLGADQDQRSWGRVQQIVDGLGRLPITMLYCWFGSACCLGLPERRQSYSYHENKQQKGQANRSVHVQWPQGFNIANREV
jgi:hypothetical protein